MRFELAVNGEPICAAGLDGFGVVNCIISWVKRNPEAVDLSKVPGATPEEFFKEQMSVNLGGLDSNDTNNKMPVTWSHKELNAGDVVTVRILTPE